jgi:hypothetical protein
MWNNSNNNMIPFRKVGIKISNLVRIERRKPDEQKTLLDYI